MVGDGVDVAPDCSDCVISEMLSMLTKAGSLDSCNLSVYSSRAVTEAKACVITSAGDSSQSGV